FSFNPLYHQFERSADDRRSVAVDGALGPDLLDNSSIGNVPAIPSQQEIHLVHCCDGDMGSIYSSLGEQQMRGKDFRGQDLCFFGVFEDGAGAQHLLAGSRRRGVTATRLRQDEPRDEKLIALSPLRPPIPSCLLLSGEQHTAAGPSRQQTGKRGFQIDLWFQTYRA